MKQTQQTGLFRTGCSGKYLDLRLRKEQETGDIYILRSFLIYIPRHI
jgi:hypothetical protein